MYFILLKREEEEALHVPPYHAFSGGVFNIGKQYEVKETPSQAVPPFQVLEAIAAGVGEVHVRYQSLTDCTVPSCDT